MFSLRRETTQCIPTQLRKEMSNLKGMSMSELIMKYNELANQLGGPSITEFKNLAAARSAVEALEKKLENPMTDTTTTVTAPDATDKAKYASTDKRGPNQGVGAFAKEMISAGMDNKSALEAVKAKFPAAKTTVACIAYYRTALKNGGTVKRKGSASPEELRAKAQALLDQASTAEKAAADKAAAAAEQVTAVEQAAA